jgi:hypothetical protein
MLDYAANGVRYWLIETIQSVFAKTCERGGCAPEHALSEFLGGELEQDDFWLKVKTNMKAGRIRLVFVADEIPAELRRIVEFLNEQMDPTEVLAVEIRQYVGQGVSTLVPRVVGRTAEAEIRKGGAESKSWDENVFFRALEERRDGSGSATARAILEWARTQGLTIEWKGGTKEGAFYLAIEHRGVAYYPVAVRTGFKNPYAQVQFAQLREAPFDDPTKLQDFCARLNRIQGVQLPEDSVGRYPSFQLSLLAEEAARRLFFEALNWVRHEIRSRP